MILDKLDVMSKGLHPESNPSAKTVNLTIGYHVTRPAKNFQSKILYTTSS